MAVVALLGRACLLAIAAVLLAGAVASSAESHGDREGRYVGTFPADPGASVSFRIKKDRVEFRARDVRFFCEGGRKERFTVGPFSMPLKRDGSFEKRIYHEALDIGSSEEFIWVRGQLRAGGRARGFVFELLNPLDPPQSENVAECSTTGFWRWQAEQVR